MGYGDTLKANCSVISRRALRPFCLPLQTKPVLFAGRLPSPRPCWFLQRSRRCLQQLSDSHRRSETEGLNRISDTKEPSFQVIVGLPSLGEFFYGLLSVQISYNAKRAIFTLLTPFPSRICHTTLAGEPEANQLPPPISGRAEWRQLFSTEAGKKKKWGRIVEANRPLLETIRKRFPQELQFFVLFNHGTVILENLKLPMDKQLSLEQNKTFYFPHKKRKPNRRAAQTTWVMTSRFIFIFYRSCGKKNQTKTSAVRATMLKIHRVYKFAQWQLRQYVLIAIEKEIN